MLFMEFLKEVQKYVESHKPRVRANWALRVAMALAIVAPTLSNAYAQENGPSLTITPIISFQETLILLDQIPIMK